LTPPCNSFSPDQVAPGLIVSIRRPGGQDSGRSPPSHPDRS
jgi:hypothetical protein